MANIVDPTNPSNIAFVTGALKALRIAQHPIDTTGGGAFSAYVETGLITAGIAANADIIQFRNPNVAPAIVERVDMVGLYSVTGFALGQARFRMVVARSWTVDGAGGNAAVLSGDSNQLRQTFAAAGCTLRVAGTGALTAGTKTYDGGAAFTALPFQGLKGLTIQIPTTASIDLMKSNVFNFFGEQENGHPLVLAQNEGFTISVNMPITGTWTAAFNIRWTEATTY